LAQHPAFVQVDRARQRAMGRPDVWGESVVVQAARALHVAAAIFGRVARTGSDYVVQPRLLEVKGGTGEPVSLEPITASEVDLLARLAPLPVAYARTLKVTLTEAEARRMDKAAQPTRSLKAFELYARGETAISQRPGQEGNEQAIDLLARAIEADPNFTVAYYTQGVVHQELGDLCLAAPRRLFEQAVESYAKAIDLRPFYGEAYVGLGEAKAAKGDIDGAIGAYTKALAYNPINPRVHMSLGKIYYSEKSLYYESVTAYKKAIDLDPNSVD